MISVVAMGVVVWWCGGGGGGGGGENTPFAPNFYSADANLQNLFFALQYPGKF